MPDSCVLAPVTFRHMGGYMVNTGDRLNNAPGRAVEPSPDPEEPAFVKWLRNSLQPTTWLGVAGLIALWIALTHQMSQDRKEAYGREIQAAETLVEDISRQID